MNRRTLERYLRTQGCAPDHEGAKHTIWRHPDHGTLAPVPRHQEIPPGTVRNICAKLGIPLPPGR